MNPTPPTKPRRDGREGRAADPLVVRSGRRTGLFGLLVLSTVLTASLPLPWGLVSAAFGIASLVVGVMALVAVVRAKLGAPPVVMLSVGMLLMVLVLLAQLVQVVFWSATVDFQTCQSQALTERARVSCTQQYEQWFLDRLPFSPAATGS